MLVYGDPKFSSSTEALVGALKRSLRNSGENRVDFWRKFLIRAGQLEQGLADFGDRAKALTATAEHLTNLGAAAFFTAWCSERAGEHLTIIHQIEALLDAFNGAEDFRLTIKVPEGYEFYALFPEQYIVSAQRWSVERGGDKSKRVLVVGVRSIGTSLSALVAESLRNQGWEARRITVRPGGDPFRRELVLEPQPAESLAIIVDEGPGLSGSSMAAVGEALEAGGFLKTQVAAFPSHGNEPGSAASSKVREWWRKVPRYFTNLDQLRWRGLSLQDILLDQSRLHLGTGDMKLQDITGGDWRQFVFGSEEDWCAFHGPFERVKYRCQAADGRAVLWKFAGLGAWTNDSLADEEAFSFFPEEDSQLRKASVTLRTLDE